MNYVGKAIPREEDLRLLQGRGRYTDDVNALNQAHAYVFRSPIAHADIRSIDTTAASKAPGVLAVLVGEDLEARGLGTLRPAAPGKRSDGSPGFVCTQPLLAQGRVRYAGEAIAFIVAETVAQAKDAAELIEIDFDALPVIILVDDALAPNAYALWDDNPSNEAYTFEKGDAAAVDTALSNAAHVIKHRVCVNRVAGNPMENRGCIAEYDSYEDRYTLRATVQSVHGIRQQIAGQIFGIPQTQLRVICDNMGGGFGTRGGCHPEYSLGLWASEIIGRPVKWIGDRTEGIMTDEQARGGLVDCELALDADFKFLGLRTHTKVPIGAYFGNDRNLRTATGGLGGLAGVYGIPAIHAKVTGGLTNMIGNAQYRGGAKPEPVYVLEVMVDVAARELGIDPIELRRRNTVGPDQMPFTTCFGDIYDCGDFVRNFEDCLKAGDYDGVDQRRADRAAHGKILGVGSSNSVTGVASTNFEHVEIRFDPSGNITLLCGAMDHGPRPRHDLQNRSSATALELILKKFNTVLAIPTKSRMASVLLMPAARYSSAQPLSMLLKRLLPKENGSPLICWKRPMTTSNMATGPLPSPEPIKRYHFKRSPRRRSRSPNSPPTSNQVFMSMVNSAWARVRCRHTRTVFTWPRLKSTQIPAR